jgi:ABC-type branched-subunit amino acid transport system substrate-binding protein
VRRVAAALVAIGALALSACSGDEPRSETLTIAVNAPLSRASYVGESLARGASLAAAAVNAGGGVQMDGTTYRLRILRLDNELSPRQAVANVRRAVADGAVAIVDEGTGVDASWSIANDAGVPVVITYQGGVGLVDIAKRPNVFRIAPTDRGISFRLAEYMIPKGLRIALLVDDSGYGEQGRSALAKAFARNKDSVAAEITLPARTGDLAPQVLQAREAGATALLVWAQAPAIAQVLVAARSAGWHVPVFTPPPGADPLVRQQVAAHREWIDGLTFASGRMTAERGPAPWEAFRAQYESAYGPDEVGVRTTSGARVVQPPEHAMYAYDAVNVLAAAIGRAGSREKGRLLDALEEVSVEGANGDQRGFNQVNHEGVVDDDVYFGRFLDMTFRPVKDDALSSTLPTIGQIQGGA